MGTGWWDGVRDVLYDWQGNANWKLAISLYYMFKTKGAYDGWVTVSDDYNELLARPNPDKTYICGTWVEDSDDNAPDLDLACLASNKSLYKLDIDWIRSNRPYVTSQQLTALSQIYQ